MGDILGREHHQPAGEGFHVDVTMTSAVVIHVEAKATPVVRVPAVVEIEDRGVRSGIEPPTTLR